MSFLRAHECRRTFKGLGLGFSGSGLVFFRIWMDLVLVFQELVFWIFKDSGAWFSSELDIGFSGTGSFSFADTKIKKIRGDRKLIRQRIDLARRKSILPDERQNEAFGQVLRWVLG